MQYINGALDSISLSKSSSELRTSRKPHPGIRVAPTTPRLKKMAKRLYIKELYDPRARGSEVDLEYYSLSRV